MFTEIFLFEIRYQLKQPVFWISCFFFSILTFLAITTDAVVIGGAIGNVNRNAPFVIMQLMLFMSVLGIFVTTAFVAGTIIRDAETGTHELFLTTRVGKRDYLLGRLSGALGASALSYVVMAAAIVLGSTMPWLEPERLGPFSPAPYLFALAALVLPNLLITGFLFFSLATVTRSLMGTYAGVVGLFAGYAAAGNLLADIENEAVAGLLDPFGVGAFTIATKYWTVIDRNTQILSLSGTLFNNRLLWLTIAAGVLAVAYHRFSFRLEHIGGSRRRKVKGADESVGPPAEMVASFRIAMPQRFDASLRRQQLLASTKAELRGVLRSIAFPIILAFGVLNMVGNSQTMDSLFGTPVYPVTHLIVSILQASFLFLYIIVTFYSGELVFRERSLNVHQVFDTLPAPNWVFWGSKAAALVFIVLAMLVTSVLTGIGIQIARGYYNFEISLYFKGLLVVVGLPFILAAVLALFLQVATNNKYLGFLLMIAYFISGPALNALDFNHNLYQYGSAPNAPYSDMNGFGHFVAPLFWFYLYWTLAAGLLLVLVHVFWIRGIDATLRARLELAAERFTRPVKTVTACFAAAWLGAGAYIFYNTNVLNEYIPGNLQEERQVAWERRYKQYQGLPQPRVTKVYADVDIYPEKRTVEIQGRYRLQNKTDGAVDTLHLNLNPAVQIDKIDIANTTLVHSDAELGYYIYKFDSGLTPGAALEIEFDLGVRNCGFVNNGSNTQLVYNGTFFNSGQYFPRIGYNRSRELSDPNTRRERGLPPIERFPKIDDHEARQNHYISSESDWIDFETVVSTSADQIAMAPGYLQREWQENGRRYFHYKTDAPILGLVAYLSAEWKVARDSWNDVAIEVYYHKGHPYNVGRMIDAVKKSLQYFTREFGPYQHRQVRILEFPRYGRFAQSLPNTIPYSESIGFIARIHEGDEETIDYVFYVTAHEVAHQWWAHQVIGGNVQGATVLSETMAQYSALMVMEKEYGPEKMRRFLKYELDNYLRSRGGELIEELPLMLVENQPYIHYRKGSVVMYALKDYVGEAALNRALAAYVEAFKFQQPPYTYTPELLSFVSRAVPEERAGLLDDLFRRITLFENKVEEATYQRRPDGRYRVRLDVRAEKFYADGMGAETETPIDDWIDIGVFGAETPGGPREGKVLALEKRRIDSGTGTIEIIVDEQPERAGIDPFNKLVDRNPENNLKRVRESSSPE